MKCQFLLIVTDQQFFTRLHPSDITSSSVPAVRSAQPEWEAPTSGDQYHLVLWPRPQGDRSRWSSDASQQHCGCSSAWITTPLAPSKVINRYCRGAEKKLTACSYAREVKWSKAKADLRVTEGNRSCGEKKKQLVHGY